MIPNTSNIELRHQYNVYRLHRFVRLRKSHFLRTRETVNIRRKERSGASVKRRLGIGRDVTSMTLYAPRLERIHCMKSRRLFSRLKRPYVRLVRSTREDHAYGASRLPKTSENDYFAVSQSRSPGAWSVDGRTDRRKKALIKFSNFSDVVWTRLLTNACLWSPILFFGPSDSAPRQDPLIGVSVVMGLLALLCIVVFAVVRRRMVTSNTQETSADVWQGNKTMNNYIIFLNYNVKGSGKNNVWTR